jgi:Ternary complex associated domain 9
MILGRSQVLWLGPAPTKRMLAECERRRLRITVTDGPLSDQDFALSRAIVFSFDESKKGESIGRIKLYASQASEHGLLIVVRATKVADERMLQGHIPGALVADLPEEFERFTDFPRPQFTLKRPAYELAELAARHPAGPYFTGASTLAIKGKPPVKQSDIFLLRRAFGDCSSITVSPLTKGFSGARVLVVYAEFPQGEAAPYPLPYFAKIDTRKRILKEYAAYERFVIRYVPFSQRPNCESKRCFVGLEDGILVGDFVDDSVALSDLVKPSGARSIIHSLFDDALRGWRQQAFYSNQRIAFSAIRAGIMEPGRIKIANFEAAKGFGARKSPNELTSVLDAAGNYDYRMGPVHGDLNTQNIRVRNGEAVLIDFYKSRPGALAADLASLEIAICFSMEADTSWNVKDQSRYEDSLRFKEWRRHIDKLFVFLPGQFGMIPPLQEQPCAHNWMWSACRQLRLMAQYIEPNEEAYAYLVAAYLLRTAMFPENEKELELHTPNAVIRSYAYWCAERILSAISSRKEAA